MRRLVGKAGSILALIVAALALAAVIVPHFLDRRYYRGGRTTHFDGAHFVNPDGDDSGRAPGGGSRAGFFWRYLTGSDGRPPWPARAAVHPAAPGDLLQPLPAGGTATPASAAEVAATPMRATWVGHATVLVQVAGLNILTDPVWSDTAGPFGFGPRRVAEPGIRLADLPRLDVILISHNHYDHLDLASLARLWRRDRPLIVTSLGNDAVLRAKGIGATALDWGQAATVSGRARVASNRYWTQPVRVVATRNHHWGSRWFADRNRALWSSFVVILPGGNLFFAGDTGLGDGRWAAEAARLGPIRLALIPIGAFRFTRGQMENENHIGPVDAVAVHRALGAATSIPIHWGTFRLSYEQYRTPPRLLAAAIRCTGQRGFAAAAIGRPVDVPPYRRPAPVANMPRADLLRCLDTPAVRALQ